jgi:outer membrane protein assembly factor BamD
MLKKYTITSLVALILLVAISSCSESYTRVQKSTDINYKLKKAVEYYNKKRYYQAIPLFEELMGLIKGDPRAEEIYFQYSNAEFEEKNYVIAAYHFKRFVEVYPDSRFAEEALYKYALSYAKQSPTSDLEQVNTERGIDAYQYFINTYPNSTRVALCNTEIDKMRKKLEEKALAIGDLYYKTGNYRAAALSFKQALREFPEITEAERVNFMILKSDYKFATLSIIQKKSDRYRDLIKDYKAFTDKYPTSKYKEEATKYFELSKFEIINSQIENASIAKAEEREKLYLDAIKNYNLYNSSFVQEKTKAKAAKLYEKAQFLIVKNSHILVESAPDLKKNERITHFNQVYQKFIDNFAGSKYKKEAEKLYLTVNNSIATKS